MNNDCLPRSLLTMVIISQPDSTGSRLIRDTSVLFTIHLEPSSHHAPICIEANSSEAPSQEVVSSMTMEAAVCYCISLYQSTFWKAPLPSHPGPGQLVPRSTGCQPSDGKQGDETTTIYHLSKIQTPLVLNNTARHTKTTTNPKTSRT